MELEEIGPHEKRPAPWREWRPVRSAVKLIASQAPHNFKDAKWRGMTWPGCPACLTPASACYCAAPAVWLPPLPRRLYKFVPARARCYGRKYLDIETGTEHCEKCGIETVFAAAVFVCHCGARFTGGEAWEGMKQDIHNASRWQWMKSVKARTEKEITGCGEFGITRLAEAGKRPPCGCRSTLYRLDGKTEICANCLRRWQL